MAFSLGSIFVELTCNTAKFLSGMDKASVAAKKTGKDIRTGLSEVGGALASLGDVGARIGSVLEGVGSKAASAFDVAANKGRGLSTLMLGTMLGGTTALAGGLFALAEHASEVGAKIYEASEKTGISAAQMSGLMAITKETRGNFDGLTTSLARAGANLEKAIIAPGAGAGKVLAQVMGSAKNLSDMGLKPMGDRLQMVLARIFAMSDVGQRNVALSSLLGRGWMENISTLRILAEQGYGPAEAAARRLGIFFDDNAARQAKQFQVAIAELKGEMSGMGVAIGQSVIPKFSTLMAMIEGTLPTVKEFGLRMLAVQAAMTGVGIPLAIKLWKDADAQGRNSTQVMTDFLLRVKSLTDGEKASTDATGKLTGALGHYRDALADLIDREREQIAALDSTSKPVRSAALEYAHTTDEIRKAVAAGGSYAESLTAQALAADLFAKKLMQIPAITPKLPGWGEIARAGNGEPPALPESWAPAQGLSTLPTSLPSFESSTPLGLAAQARDMDKTRAAEHAWNTEMGLSVAALGRLAAAFPGMTNAEIDASAAGQRFIEQLAKTDKSTMTLAEHFAEMKEQIIEEGQDLGGHLAQIFESSLNSIEDQFAHLAVTGRANFRQLGQSIEESLLKAGMQKGVSTILGGLGLPGSGNKPDGSSGNPLWVKMAGAGLPGLGQGNGTGAGPDSGALQLPAGVTTIFQTLAKGMGGIGSFLGKVFGGFLAEGGDTMPGKAYMVGEKHAELFVPGVSGRVVPQIGTQQLRPLHYSATYNINTPNPDAFRRSQSQILADGYRQMAKTHARNS